MTPKPYSPEFLTFWQVYPRHTAKTKAWQAFQRLKVTPTLLATMLDALDWQRETAQWRKDGGEFIPYPASWLNGRRWEDEPVLELASRPKSLGPVYRGWECPHDPACEDRRWCALKTAKAEVGL